MRPMIAVSPSTGVRRASIQKGLAHQRAEGDHGYERQQAALLHRGEGHSSAAGLARPTRPYAQCVHCFGQAGERRKR